jgi:hypothetical protein
VCPLSSVSVRRESRDLLRFSMECVDRSNIGLDDWHDGAANNGSRIGGRMRFPVILGAATALAACTTTAEYRGANANWSERSTRPPLSVAACIADNWGTQTHRFKALPNAKGQTLVLEGGPPEWPVVDAVVDIEGEGAGSVVRYGGRLRGIALPWVEGSVRGCLA